MPYKDKKDALKWHARERARRKALGLCRVSGCPNRIAHNQLCERHADMEAAHNKIRQKRHRAKCIKRFVCARCMKPLDKERDEGNITCLECRERGYSNVYWQSAAR